MLDISILGKRIRKVRRRQNITQEALAREADVAINTIARLEQGWSQEIRSGALKRIADALNVSADYLLGRTDIDDSKPDDPAKRHSLETATA